MDGFIIVIWNVIFSMTAVVSSIVDQSMLGSIKTYQYFCEDNSSAEIFNGLITCQQHRGMAVKDNVTVLEGICLNYDAENLIFEAGICFYSDKHKVLPKTIRNVSTFNEDVMCVEQNRSGMLCGKCKENFSVSITSYQFRCMDSTKCHKYNWILFILANCIPVSILFLLVVMFDIKLISGYANTYILLAQFLSLQVNVIHISSGLGYIIKNRSTDWILTKLIVSFYSIWSLDLANTLCPDICVCHNINSLDAIALQYFPAFYSLALVLITCCFVELHANNYRIVVLMWKPFRKCFSRIRRQINPSASLINAFATFLLLSHSKLTVTSFLLLMPAKLYNKTGQHVSTVLFYDGTLEYLESTYHRCLFILAIVVLIVFVFLPPLLLLLYPWRMFQTLLTKLRLNRPELVILMDCFQGCFKDGRNGGRDHRWFSSVYFLLRIIIFSSVMMSWSPWDYSFNPLVQLQEHIILASCILMLTCFDPYKFSLYTKLDIIVFLYVLILGVFNSYNVYEINFSKPNYEVSESLMVVFLSLPALTATVIVSYYCIKRLYVIITKRFHHHLYLHMPILVLFQENDEERLSLLSEKCQSNDIPDRLLHPDDYLY